MMNEYLDLEVVAQRVLAAENLIDRWSASRGLRRSWLGYRARIALHFARRAWYATGCDVHFGARIERAQRTL
jgi:hypothetical protein